MKYIRKISIALCFSLVFPHDLYAQIAQQSSHSHGDGTVTKLTRLIQRQDGVFFLKLIRISLKTNLPLLRTQTLMLAQDQMGKYAF